MLIEIYSDTICPWCYIGKRRLERALAMRPELTVDIKWRAFQLNPWMPTSGMARGEYLAAKFGSRDAAQIYAQIAQIGLGEDIPFRFDRIERTPNTLQSHRLLRWADRQGAQGPVVDGLFRAYFEEGRDVGSDEVLAEIAGDGGLDGDAAASWLAGDEEIEAVREEDATARRMGIQGVPCFIVEGSYAVSGAQEPEYFMPLFDLVLTGSPAPA